MPGRGVAVDGRGVAQVPPHLGQVVFGVQSRVSEIDAVQDAGIEQRAVDHVQLLVSGKKAVVAPAVSPPSITNSWPVTNAAASEARKKKASAISSGAA